MEKINETIATIQVDAPVCHYIYDMDALATHVQDCVQSLPENCEMYYAMKANSEVPILSAMSQYVAGFEVASQGEVEKAQAHVASNHIIFGGPGKTDAELRYAVQSGVRRIHVESLYELQRLNAILEEENLQQSILLRANLSGPFPEATLHMAGRPTQFGISEEDMDTVIQKALALPHIHLEGFHFHSISNNLDAELHLRVMALYFQKAKSWAEKHQFELQHLNLGGGIGVNYKDLNAQFDWPHFVAGFKAVIEAYEMQDVTLNFECGRYLVAHIGYYATEVLDIKKVHQEWFVILKGGTQQFRLPVSWQHNHPFEVYTSPLERYAFEKVNLINDAATFVGQLCTPKDVFAKQVDITEIATGDVVVFQYAGAYGWSISHHDFLSHPHPEFIYLSQH
ncbi:type III PLP-dependent enzyme [Staphylococcus coagulans]|uniref:type III PLP-dependent enzyme n=1 Tax=Staphylococcus coagulans TaxID=74706 RepID=UPI0015F88A7C|nr:type III PLP-dependent enzyme [Staphylococcus coagulans]MBA8764327.1 siderophore biosynthesis PLP-dependent protein [Staphylococcus coagulans]MBT2809787.1 type III PLP-dependent enzyme [Staphylococcus coagulans]MBT2811929.1 type III PLP-dependent enzyme [Staphylococcus coagulans]MBT2818961.1 type III PLP-dependent enzyme [Staphylococcus coagulans]MBT2821333.1 type III PLP-dependent enzyme [Staphylococcus coagulans]